MKQLYSLLLIGNMTFLAFAGGQEKRSIQELEEKPVLKKRARMPESTTDIKELLAQQTTVLESISERLEAFKKKSEVLLQEIELLEKSLFTQGS